VSDLPRLQQQRVHLYAFCPAASIKALMAGTSYIFLLVFVQAESLGYVDISLSDVVKNKRINEKYTLIDSKHGQIQVELLWRST
jgi:hypothetical protein